MSELDSSRSTLQTFEQRRQAARRQEATSPPTTEGTTDNPRTISCQKCNQPNARDHRFCRQCGSILWRPCPQCGSDRLIDEEFCAACGTNIGSTERRAIEASKELLLDARKMITRLELNAALRTLNKLVNRDHPHLEETCAAAKQLIPQVTAQRDEQARRATIFADRARILLDELRFVEAVKTLNQIPVPLRDRQARDLLDQATAAMDDIVQLKQQLRRSEGVTLPDRMAAMQRLLELRPHDPQVKRWANQVHEHVLATAQKKAEVHRYHESVELLRGLPEQIRRDESRKLQRHTEELAYLASELRLAPTVDAVSMEAAKRLLRVDANNEEARVALREMTQRRRAANKDSAALSVEWTPCPETSHVRMPVHAYPTPRRLRFASAEMRARFRQYPGQFLVACGLALQALQQAAVPINLLPAARQGVLGRLRTSLRERPPTSGWGLDFGNTGLKVIQLTMDDDGQVHVTACTRIARRVNLANSDPVTAGQSTLLESLKEFVALHSIKATDRVATQWPGMESLVRYLTIPPVEGKQLNDLIERETQHQIPFPRAEVGWDTFRFPLLPTGGGQNQVLLVAAKLNGLNKRVELLSANGIPVHAIQCDALALHNFLCFDLLTNENDSRSNPTNTQCPDTQCPGIATLDVGSAATGIIFSFPDFVWYRATRPAGDDLTTGLTRRFKITREVAEKAKRNPVQVKRLSDLHDESCVVFRKMVAQFETAMNAMHSVAPRRLVQQLLVTGGGSQTHGLLRFFRFGQ